MVNTLLLVLYALIGVVMALAGIESFRAKDNPARIGTGLFWLILAVIFAFGTLLPAMVVGILVVVIGILALFKQIQIGKSNRLMVRMRPRRLNGSAVGSLSRVSCWQLFRSRLPSSPSSAVRSASGLAQQFPWWSRSS